MVFLISLTWLTQRPEVDLGVRYQSTPLSVFYQPRPFGHMLFGSLATKSFQRYLGRPTGPDTHLAARSTPTLSTCPSYRSRVEFISPIMLASVVFYFFLESCPSVVNLIGPRSCRLPVPPLIIYIRGILEEPI